MIRIRIDQFVAISIIGIAAMALMISSAPLPKWAVTHWLFSYRDGMFRRAFMGSVFEIFFPSGLSYSQVTVIALVFLLLFSVAYVTLAWMTWKSRPSLDTYMLILCALIAPATLRFFPGDLGRFDPILILIVIICIFVLLYRPGPVGFGIVGAFAALGVAVHEEFFIGQLPILLAIMIVESRRDSTNAERLAGSALAKAALSTLPAAAIFFYAVIHPGLAYEDVARVTKALGDRTDVRADVNIILHQTRNTAEHLSYTWSTFIHDGLLFRFVPLLVSLPAVAIAVEPLSCRGPRQGVVLHTADRWVLVAGALSPLCLMPIGTNWGRWTAMTVTNLFIVSMWVLIRSSMDLSSGKRLHASGGPYSSASGNEAENIVKLSAVALCGMIPTWDFFGRLNDFASVFAVLRRLS